MDPPPLHPMFLFANIFTFWLSSVKPAIVPPFFFEKMCFKEDPLGYGPVHPLGILGPYFLYGGPPRQKKSSFSLKDTSLGSWRREWASLPNSPAASSPLILPPRHPSPPPCCRFPEFSSLQRGRTCDPLPLSWTGTGLFLSGALDQNSLFSSLAFFRIT